MAQKIKKFFVSYSSEDKEFVDRFTGVLNYKKGKKNLLNCLEIIIDDKFLFTGVKIKDKVFQEEISKGDGYILIVSNASLKSNWVNIEYRHAMNIINNNSKFRFIPILIEDLNNIENKLDFELNKYKYSDFRSPFSFLKDMDTLIKTSLCRNLNPRVREKLIYNNSISPNIENLRFQKIIDYVLSDAFSKYVTPLQEDIDRMIKLQQANERIMTIEAIAEKEKTANDNIWVISTHLNNDINDADIKESVKINQTKKPNIKYTYFVPKKSALIKKRIKSYKDFHLEKNEGKTYDFIKIDKDEAIMPFAELVIYDPDDHTTAWGYVELNYDVASDKNSVFLRLPQRNLCPLIDLLRKKKEKHDENKNKKGKNK